MSRHLTLPLKRIYFDEIKSGSKLREYRLCTPYWAKRLEGRDYDKIILTLGYPAAADKERRLVMPWRGFEKMRITHPHFGPSEVEVYAILVGETENIY